VANPPRRPQACRGGGHRAHELVGVKAALHEQLAFRLMDQFDALCGRFVGVNRVDQLEPADVNRVLPRQCGDACLRSD
jgi:hypothetical protein